MNPDHIEPARFPLALARHALASFIEGAGGDVQKIDTWWQDGSMKRYGADVPGATMRFYVRFRDQHRIGTRMVAGELDGFHVGTVKRTPVPSVHVYRGTVERAMFEAESAP